MAKLKLEAPSTFKAKVEVPIPGEDKPAACWMTFKYRKKSEFQKWLYEREGADDVESFLNMVEGWDLEVEFTRANVETFLDVYAGASLATLRAYTENLLRHRVGN